MHRDTTAEMTPHRSLRHWMMLGLVCGLVTFSVMRAWAGAYEDWRDAVSAHEKREYNKAIALYSRAINEGAYTGKYLAQLYRMRGKAKVQSHGIRLSDDIPLLESAFDDMSASIKLDPKNSATYNDRGAILGMMNKLEAAVADYSEAIKLHPNFFWPYNNRCLAYEKMKRRKEAITDCRKALALNPTHKQPKITLKRLGVIP